MAPPSVASVASVASVGSLEVRARGAVAAGDLDGAVRLYAEAVSRGTTSPDVFNDLGVLLAGRGQLALAVVQLEVALAYAPTSVNIRANLLKALEDLSAEAFRARRWADAAAGYTRLAVLDPVCAIFQTNAGMALRELRRPEQALPYLRRARDLQPQSSVVRMNLGSALFDLNQRESETELQRAIELDPLNANAHINLAAVQSRLGQLARAAATIRKAQEIVPDHVEAHANLAGLLREQGEIELSLEHYRRALTLRPDSPLIWSGYLLARQADATATPGELLADHLEWNGRFAAPLDPGPSGGYGQRDRDPDRRLRVGYVSADFRSHAVASFIEPILTAHDRTQVHVTCYSDATPDAVTQRIRGQAHPDEWRDIRTSSDEALARSIVEDRIDVLVDLAGHTAGNRLLCFARRPAPVQVTYCGYPATTGLASIGWRLTDAIADPGSEAQPAHSEQLWRLPNGFLCYLPDPGFGAPAPAPSLARGFVTFGSFNNLSKLGDQVLKLWAELLRAVPDSHLLLKSRALTDDQPRERLRACFSRWGVEPERIDFAPYAATTVEHASLYGRVDVALDPFPYNGTTTTCEALWMGVAVVTLVGRTHAGRVGASLLTRIGCADLVAPTPERYLQVAADLANDSGRRTALRQDLRTKMAASSLTDARVIARDIETAYRQMWRERCKGQGPGAGY